MRPEGVALALLFWAALALLLPKRSLANLRERFRLLGEGRRTHLFGPPSLTAGAAATGPVGWLRANAGGILECGVPLFMVAAVIGTYGRQRRRERQLLWADTETGLAWRLLEGELDDEDVARRLVTLGSPPLRAQPAAAGGSFERPPLAWTREWEAERLGVDLTAEEQAEIAVPFRRSMDRGLTIRTLGPLSIRSGEEELAPALLRRPVLAFLWVLLLILGLDERGPLSDRAPIAEELAPGSGDRSNSSVCAAGCGILASIWTPPCPP